MMIEYDKMHPLEKNMIRKVLNLLYLLSLIDVLEHQDCYYTLYEIEHLEKSSKCL